MFIASKHIVSLPFFILSSLLCLALIAIQLQNYNQNKAASKRLNKQAEEIVQRLGEKLVDRQKITNTLTDVDRRLTSPVQSMSDNTSTISLTPHISKTENVKYTIRAPSDTSYSNVDVSKIREHIESSRQNAKALQPSIISIKGTALLLLKSTASQPPLLINVDVLNVEKIMNNVLKNTLSDEFNANIRHNGSWLMDGAFNNDSVHVQKTFQLFNLPMELFIGYQSRVDDELIMLVLLFSILFMFLLVCFIRRNRAFHQRQRRYHAAVNVCMDSLIIVEPLYHEAVITDLEVVQLNDIALSLFMSKKREDVLGNSVLQLQDEYNLFTPELLHELDITFRSDKSYTKTMCKSSRQGNEHWISIKAVKKDAGVSVTIRDITNEKVAGSRLRSCEEKYHRLVAGLNGQFVFQLDENENLTDVSHTVSNTLGYTPQEFIENYSAFTIDFVRNTLDEQGRLLSDNGHETYTVQCRHKDGTYRHLEVTHVFVRNKENRVIAIEGVAKDVTNERELQRKLFFQANHDQITGLFNRYAFEQEFAKQQHKDKILNASSVLCFIDMDQFKMVNDSCGHQAGDQLLRQMAALFRQNINKGDILARLGGDEFGILFIETNMDTAKKRVKRLLKSIERYRFIWDGKIFDVGASIGLVELDENVFSMGQYIDHADSACHVAKGRGSNRYHVYTPNDDEVNFREREIYCVSYIKDAFINQRFRLYCQAIVPLDESEQGLHYEVLLRILSEDDTVISPGEFIPVAERFGLMPKIDFWVVENTLNALTSNMKHLQELGKCSINLSGSSLSDDEFMSQLIAALDRSRVPLDKLCFEITETSAVTKLNVATKFIKTLRKKGCVFALDDFGTGMSSFSYLKNLPVDYLKIDGSFVRNMVKDPLDRAMVKSINDIGQTMGKKTIAEFVSDFETKALLKEIGVNYAQGFAIGKPQLLDDVIRQSTDTSIGQEHD